MEIEINNTAFAEESETAQETTQETTQEMTQETAQETTQEAAPIVRQRIADERSVLDKWAYIWYEPHDTQKGPIAKLAKIAQPEKWYYGAKPKNGENEILWSYIKYTFRRLVWEDKICYKEYPAENEDYAVFNTGLLNRFYKEIYAVFIKNTEEKKPQYWFCQGFCTWGTGWLGNKIAEVFQDDLMPERADYLQSKGENVFLDLKKKINLKDEHILLDRLDRLPKPLLQSIFTGKTEELEINGDTLDSIGGKDDNTKRRYFNEVRKRIEGDSNLLLRMMDTLYGSLSRAIKKVEWNYKTAVPMYDPVHNKCNFLLPLSLVDIDTVDVALLVEDKGNSYLAHTILTLDMAYCNSRLITRPDSEWLNVEGQLHMEATP